MTAMQPTNYDFVEYDAFLLIDPSSCSENELQLKHFKNTH